MIEFCLEKALAGEKVITRDGREVTQLHKFDGDVSHRIACVVDNRVVSFVEGNGVAVINNNYDLFMAPKPLSGFVNVYADRTSRYLSKNDADNGASKDRIACIDLSIYNEGEGL